MIETMKAAGQTVVVRVDFPVSKDLAEHIAAWMVAMGETLTVENLRRHAREAYSSEGNMVECDVSEWCVGHFTPHDEPETMDWVTSHLWLSGLTL